MKLFPFDPAKAQTITNPDGFPVHSHGGRVAKEAYVFSNGAVSIVWADDGSVGSYPKDYAQNILRLGPKPGKTVYLNCWKTLYGDEGWNTHDSEEEAKTIAAQHEAYCKYTYIAIPVTGPEIEP